MPASIDITFRHGLGDCVCLAHVLELCRRRGIRVRVSGDANKEALWKLSGVETGAADAPAHDWSHPDGWGDRASPDVLANKVAFNLNRWPLPDLGDREALWEELCELRLGVRARVPEWAWRDADAFLEGRQRPLLLLHANGNSATRDKDLPLNLVLATQILFADRGFGVVVLDWDRRTPVLRLPELSSIQERWSRMPLECLAALQYRADVLVGIDSGPLHFASLTDVPCVGIWRRHLPSRSGLPNPRSIHLVPRSLVEASPEERLQLWRSVGYALDEPTAPEILAAVEELMDRTSGPGWRTTLGRPAADGSLAGSWGLASEEDLPDSVMADAPLVEITERGIAAVDGVGVSCQALQEAWGAPLEFHVNRSRSRCLSFALLALDRDTGEKIELGLAGSLVTRDRIEVQTYASGASGQREEVVFRKKRRLWRVRRAGSRDAAPSDPLLAALRLGTWQPDLASYELEQLVDLPTPEERRAAADRLAGESRIATSELLEAMRDFGSFGEAQRGAFTVTAAVWTGKDMADCRTRVLVPESYESVSRGPLLVLSPVASISLEPWEGLAETHAMPIVAPELPGGSLAADRLALLDVIRWARRHFDVDETRILLRTVGGSAAKARDLAWPYLDRFASVGDLSPADSAPCSALASPDVGRRDPLPDRVLCRVEKEPLRRYWVEVLPLSDEPVEVEVELIERGRIHVRRKGPAALRLLLAESMLDEDGEIVVELDGESERHAPALDRRTLLLDFAERFDRLFLPTHEVWLDEP